MNIKNIMLTLLIAAAAIAGSAKMVRADEDIIAEQEQECRQVVETECEAGAYGQVTNCKTKAEQICEQRQKVSKEGKVLAKVHEPVETALDLQTMVLATGVLASGAGAYALKRKIK